MSQDERPEGERRKRGRPRGTYRGGLKAMYGVKVSPEFVVWLAEFAKYTKARRAELFREGMRLAAEKRGFRQPPAR